ncbi:MAG: TIGR03564 family F420-dependent LLM class oxidoreductase [Acidimicrobiales bacterium]
MRYGLMIGDEDGQAGAGLDHVVSQARHAAELGMASVAMSQIFSYDALTALAVIGREVPGIGLSTAVVPTYPRHPMVLAGQALTTNAACGGRLLLGIGLSHQIVIESMFGYSFAQPARHMEEYLSVLMPLLRGETVSFKGESVSAVGAVSVPGATAPAVVLAALGSRMLKLAGTLADGTVTWMTGPATVADHIVPTIVSAAQGAGRPSPRVGVGLPVCVTDDPDGARETAAGLFSIYGQLPSYQAMLAREGVDGPAGVAIVGDEDSVAAQIGAVAEAGATDFVAAVFGSSEEATRGRALISSLARG